MKTILQSLILGGSLLLTPLLMADEAATLQQQFFDVVGERLAINGEELLCEQEGYSACFDADKKACMVAQSAHKADCLQAFSTDREQHPGTNHTVVFMHCMKDKHIEAASEKHPAAGECVETAMKTFKSSTYSKRVEVMFALTMANQDIADELCEQETLFACLNDTPAICKQRAESIKTGCMSSVRLDILNPDHPPDEEQAARDYMSCLMESNRCE